MVAKLALPSKDEEEAYHSYVHTPLESDRAFNELAKMIFGTTGSSSGSRVIDHYVIPTRPGWYRYWLARPGEGKTTMLRAIAMKEARRLLAEQLTDRFYVAHITWEESVDSQELYYRERSYTGEDFWRGLVDPERVKKEGISRPQLPIYMLGNSMLKANIDTKPMTIERCIAALRAIFKIEGKSPSVIIADYAQEIEVERPGKKRTEDVISAVKDLIYMAGKLKCPVELGVQAKQTSLDRAIKIPDQRDIEWAFYTHQKAQIGIGLWRPWITEKDEAWVKRQNPTINIGGREYPMSPNLMIAKPLKHRPGLLRMMIPYELYPDSLEIKDFAGLVS